MDELCYMCHRKLNFPQAIRLDYQDRLGKSEVIEYRVCDRCLQKVSSYIEEDDGAVRLIYVPAEDPEDPFET